MLLAVGRPKKVEKTEQVRVYASIARRIGMIARAHDMDVSDWLSEAIRSLVDREYEKAFKKAAPKPSQPREAEA